MLKGTNNQTVELKIAKDRSFKNMASSSLDSGWLRIYINVHSDLGNWQTVDESLMLSEFKEMINWFRELSLNKKVRYPQLYFTEPNLELDLTEEDKNIK